MWSVLIGLIDMRALGQQAKMVAELQGRQECNIFHVLIALD